MNEHTKEPWSVAEEAFDNDGIHESVIRGLDGRAAIAVTLEFGPNNPGMREANARRIVACVNACAGITTEVLEQMPSGPASLLPMYSRLEQQRDKLLAALEELLSGTMSMPNRGRATEGKWTTINALTDTVEKARSVVAEAKGEGRIADGLHRKICPTGDTGADSK